MLAGIFEVAPEQSLAFGHNLPHTDECVLIVRKIYLQILTPIPFEDGLDGRFFDTPEMELHKYTLRP